YRIDNDAAVRAELEKTVATLADPRSMQRSPSVTAAPQVAAAKGRPQAARQAPAYEQTGSVGGVVARGVKGTLAGLLDGIFKALLGESSPAPAPKSRRPTLEEYQVQQEQR